MSAGLFRTHVSRPRPRGKMHETRTRERLLLLVLLLLVLLLRTACLSRRRRLRGHLLRPPGVRRRGGVRWKASRRARPRGASAGTSCMHSKTIEMSGRSGALPQGAQNLREIVRLGKARALCSSLLPLFYEALQKEASTSSPALRAAEQRRPRDRLACCGRSPDGLYNQGARVIPPPPPDASGHCPAQESRTCCSCCSCCWR